MDALTVSAVTTVLSKFLGSASAEAGKSAWAGLARLVHSAFPDRSAATEAVEQLTPGTAPDPNAVIDLSAELVGLARSDAGFDGALREWLGQARSVSVDRSVTINVIREGSIVNGTVIQARSIDEIHNGGQ